MDPLVAQGATRMFAGTLGGQSPIATPLNLDGFPSRRREAAAECEGFPRFVGRSGQASGTVVGGTQVFSVARPSGITTGDWLIASGFNSAGVQFDSPGWVEIAHSNGPTGRTTMLYKVAGSAEPATYTFTSHSAAGGARVAVAAYRGVLSLGQVHVTGAPTGVHNEYTTPGLTALEHNDALVIIAAGSNAGGANPITFVDGGRVDSTAGSPGYAAVASAVLIGGGATPNYRALQSGNQAFEYVMTTLVGCGRFHFGIDDIVTPVSFIGATGGSVGLGQFDLTLGLPVGAQVGDLAVVNMANGLDGGFSPMLSLPVGWTGVNWTNSASPTVMNGYHFIETGETTFLFQSPRTAVLSVYRNVDSRLPLAQAGVASRGNGRSITALGITASAHSRVAFHCPSGSFVTSPPGGGFSVERQELSNPGGGVGLVHVLTSGKTEAADGATGNVTATQQDITTWYAQLLEFNALHTPI